MAKLAGGGSGNSRARGVIFDFDGTIADSWPAILEVAEQLMGRTEHFTQAEIDERRDISLRELVKSLGIPMWKVPMMLWRGRKMLKKHMHGIPVHEGMDDVLERLHRRGVPLYVVSSNGTENVQQYLAWHKLSHCFTAVYGGASIITSKAPRLRQMVREQGLDAAHSWYVGDETRDVAAARAVGLKSASVTWGFNTRAALAKEGPDAVVDTAKQLGNVLDA